MKSLLFGFLFFISCCTYAQDQASVSKNLLSVSFLLPGVEYETSITDQSTIDLRAGTGFAYSTGMYRETEYGIYLNFLTQYRYFYNLDRRLKKGKIIENNSGNFIALNGALYSGEPIIGSLETLADFSGEIGPVWGIQRVYNSGFKLNLHLGAGFVFNDLGESGISPIIGFGLGWLILN